jgi:hypothetical protein
MLMLHRLTSVLLGLCTLAAGPLLPLPARASAFDVKTSGTILSLGAVDTTTGDRLLAINTRLGPKSLLISASTLLLLNNHTTTAQNITGGEQANVTYNYNTLVIKELHLFNETKITGKVISATATSVTLRKNGTDITLTTNAGSVMDLNNIPLSSASVLVGQKATFIFEPGSNLLLSSASSATVTQGTLSAVDVTNNLVTLAGKTPLSLTVDSNATILRNGAVVPLSSLVAGDRLRIAFTKDLTDPNNPVLRLLALEASPLTNSTPAKK